MRTTSLLFLGALGADTVFAGAELAPKADEVLQPMDAYVYHCNDGDTCRLKVAGGLWLNVRLAGIDAPEVGHGKKRPGQPLGDGARDAINGMIEAKTVKVRQVDLDQYNRPVVELFLGDLLVNKKLVEDGWAEVYRGKTKRMDKGSYLAAEEAAKKAKKGIWAQASYESPSEFRKSWK